METSKSSSGGCRVCCNNCWVGWKTVWPPLLVTIVIGFIYTVFMIHNVLPQYERATNGAPKPLDPNDPNDYTPSYGEIITVLISFHVLFFLLLLTFLRSSITSPGYIPTSEPWLNGKFLIPTEKENVVADLLERQTLEEVDAEKYRELLSSLPVVERKMGESDKDRHPGYRFCHKCGLYKPDRAHHCSICKRCVLRMDHHCPWIANCVGFENYKFFLLFLLYGSACAAFVCGAMLRRVIKCFRPVLDTSYFLRADLPVIMGFLLAAFLFLALFIFFLWHMGLVFNSLTTIELREKQNSDKPKVRQQWMIAHQKYDRGSRYSNFLHIFGSWWMWLLPIKSDKAGRDGTYMDVSSIDC